MILCVGTTPAAQRVMVFDRLVAGEVNRARITLDGFAGKSVNVAKVLRRLGQKTTAAGFYGGERGAQLVEYLREMGAETEFVELGIPTRQCITVINEATGATTELVEESAPAPEECYQKLVGIVSKRVTHCRALVLSGTITPGGPVGFYRECVELASRAGCLAVVDAKGVPLEEALKASPGLVKPNRTELALTVGAELPNEDSVIRAMAQLRRKGAQRVVVTAGHDPVLAYDGIRTWRIRPPRVTVANPIGSGDSFTAALVWRLVQGDDLGEACRWGTAAGSANALSLMPGELNAAEVRSLAEQTVVEPVASGPLALPSAL